MSKILSYKTPDALTRFSDYALILAVGDAEQITVDYYDFPWETICQRHSIREYPVHEPTNFIYFPNPQPLPDELQSHQSYLLEILKQNHHAFTFEDQLSLTSKPWPEVEAILRKRLNQNCDKIFRDWLEECAVLHTEITKGNTCYWQKPGGREFFTDHLQLLLAVKYGGGGEKGFFLILTDEDVAKFRADPETLNWPVNIPTKTEIIAKFNNFLTTHDFLY